MREPAAKWDEGFLLGNGRLGAIWLGGVAEDRIFLNHENLWRGIDKHLQTPVCHQHMTEIRQAFFSREWGRAKDLCTRYLSGPDIIEGALNRIQPYQVFGQLDLTFHGVGQSEDYLRELCLTDALAATRFTSAGAEHRRELFVSAAHDVVVLRLRAAASSLNVRIALTRENDPDCTMAPWARDNRLGFTGRFREGIEFAAEARLFTDGAITATETALDVARASDLMVILTMAVDYSEPGPATCCEKRLDVCPTRYAALLAAHKADYTPLYNRCALELESPPETCVLPTDVRIGRLRRGGEDPGLFALAFNFGRYLLLSCSRSCEQPANLQGIWNPLLRPPWESDFHIDVNVQMNYWSAESCNLPECAEPLLVFLERHEKGAREAARNYYNCRGIHMGTGDMWQMHRYLASGCDVLPTCAAWLAEHFWWHYEFTGDVEFLRRRAYPFLKGVAEFWEDFLVPHPETGKLVTVPSQSPENWFRDGSVSSNYCVAPTFDLILVREVLDRCLTASRTLGVDGHLRPVWLNILKRLAPFQIGKHGQLQEWLDDFDEADPGHRHVSHLLGVFPGELMGPTRLPRYNRAARVSLERRIKAGGGNTEWSQVWKCALFARWLDGDRAAEQLKILLTDLCTRGMLTFHPGPALQIDGNLGMPGVMAEMLLQSHCGTLRLLPALPASWPSGSVRGLRARHGITVDIEWRGGKLLRARLLASRSGPVRIAYCNKTIVRRLKNGQGNVLRVGDFSS
jgi:alpha-L-fucosidase 2